MIQEGLKKEMSELLGSISEIDCDLFEYRLDNFGIKTMENLKTERYIIEQNLSIGNHSEEAIKKGLADFKAKEDELEHSKHILRIILQAKSFITKLDSDYENRLIQNALNSLNSQNLLLEFLNKSSSDIMKIQIDGDIDYDKGIALYQKESIPMLAMFYDMMCNKSKKVTGDILPLYKKQYELYYVKITEGSVSVTKDAEGMITKSLFNWKFNINLMEKLLRSNISKYSEHYLNENRLGTSYQYLNNFFVTSMDIAMEEAEQKFIKGLKIKIND